MGYFCPYITLAMAFLPSTQFPIFCVTCMVAGSCVLYMPMGPHSFSWLCMLILGGVFIILLFFYFVVWAIGVLLLLLVMASAFLGYVLPWGQISFWGATVITNLLSAFPYFGSSIVVWLWGGFSVDTPTLTRFFTFHFLTPFLVTAVSVFHIFFLHQTGSNNPLGVSSHSDKVVFH